MDTDVFIKKIAATASYSSSQPSRLLTRHACGGNTSEGAALAPPKGTLQVQLHRSHTHGSRTDGDALAYIAESAYIIPPLI